MRTMRMDAFTFTYSRKACMAFFPSFENHQGNRFCPPLSLQKQARGCFGGLEGVGGIASQIFLPISKTIPITFLVLTPKTTFDFGDPWERHPSRVTSNQDMRRLTIQNIRETLDDRSNLFLFCDFHLISLFSRPTLVTYITRHCTICIAKDRKFVLFPPSTTTLSMM